MSAPERQKRHAAAESEGAAVRAAESRERHAAAEPERQERHAAAERGRAAMTASERQVPYAALRNILPMLVFALLVIQPILDVAGYWQQVLGLPSVVTLVIRMAVLLGTIVCGFLLSNRKKVYIIAACILATLTALHAGACLHMPEGYREPVADLINLVRIYNLPLMTISLVSFLRSDEKVFPALLKGMAGVLLIDAAVMLVSALTGTDPHTYNFTRYDTVSYGVRGWFLWTNSQSAILSMLCPVSICYASRRYPDRLLPVCLMAAVSEAALFFLAPRLAFASMAAGGVCAAAGLFLSAKLSPEREQVIGKDGIITATEPCVNAKLSPRQVTGKPVTSRVSMAAGKRKQQAVAVLLITILFILCYPFSPGNRRLSYFDLARDAITGEAAGLGLSEEPDAEEASVTADGTWEDRLEKLYRSQDMLWSAIERFGRDRVFAAYDYTTDPDILADMRTKKIVFCRLLMEDAGILSCLFGLNLKDMTYDRIGADRRWTTDNYDVENDFHGIYFLTGTVGLALMIAFLAAFAVKALVAFCRSPRQFMTPVMIGLGCAFGLALIHAYFTASILRRNNASVYLAAVLAGIWVLADGKAAEEG